MCRRVDVIGGVTTPKLRHETVLPRTQVPVDNTTHRVFLMAETQSGKVRPALKWSC
jgi:hypothetical protein